MTAPNNEKADWRPATPDAPCPVCAGASWCSASADGNVVCCRRRAEGGTAAPARKGVRP